MYIWRQLVNVLENSDPTPIPKNQILYLLGVLLIVFGDRVLYFLEYLIEYSFGEHFL